MPANFSNAKVADLKWQAWTPKLLEPNAFRGEIHRLDQELRRLYTKDPLVARRQRYEASYAADLNKLTAARNGSVEAERADKRAIEEITGKYERVSSQHIESRMVNYTAYGYANLAISQKVKELGRLHKKRIRSLQHFKPREEETKQTEFDATLAKLNVSCPKHIRTTAVL